MSFTVEFHDAKALRIVHIVTENGCTFAVFSIAHSCTQTLFQAVAMENIIAQNHCNAIFADKFLTDNKSLRQAIGAGLLSIRKL